MALVALFWCKVETRALSIWADSFSIILYIYIFYIYNIYIYICNSVITIVKSSTYDVLHFKNEVK